MEVKEVSKLCDCVTKVYAQTIGKSLWMISKDMERKDFLSIDEAQDYGIKDFVMSNNIDNSYLYFYKILPASIWREEE